MLFIYLFVCLFRATPTAYGGSQARGQIGAVTAGLCHSHSNTGSEPHLWPTPQLMVTSIPNLLSKARDRTFILMDASQIYFHWAMMGIPQSHNFWIKEFTQEFLLWLSGLRTQHSVHEDLCSIPGLFQWVKDLRLPQSAAYIADVAWIQYCCGCGVGWLLQFWFSLRTSMCHRCGPKKKKKRIYPPEICCTYPVPGLLWSVRR